MPYTTLISTQLLEENLSTPGWVVVDCRFDLANPDWGYAEYQKGHIPGAVFADLNRDLSTPPTPQTGRHPLPSPEQCVALFERLGIRDGAQVVIYDTSSGGMAARLWVMLRLFGFHHAALLDGSLTKWKEENRPLEQGINQAAAALFTGEFHPEFMVDTAGVEKILHDPTYRLLDARSPERYRGEVEPIDAVAGHIPGATNFWFLDNLQLDGTFIPVDELRQKIRQALGDVKPENAILYCGSGVTNGHLLLAMEHAGFSGAKVYPGSWSEWIRNPAHPIAKGEKQP